MLTNAIVVNIMLDGQNYPEWTFCVQTALRGHGLLFHLTEDSPALAVVNLDRLIIIVGLVLLTIAVITLPSLICQVLIAAALLLSAARTGESSICRPMLLLSILCLMVKIIQNGLSVFRLH